MEDLPLYKKKKAYLKYTLVFSVCMVTFYMIYYLNDISFIQTGNDGYTQSYMFLGYIGNHIRGIIKAFFSGEGIDIPLFSFNMGLGDDILTTLSYVGGTNPLVVLLATLTPMRYTEILYEVLVVVHLYLAGISFVTYCCYKNVKLDTISCGGIIYVFSGFAMFYVMRYMYFITPLIFLPLLFMGIEKVLKENKSACLVSSVFLLILCNYYFFYMCTIIALIYGLNCLYFQLKVELKQSNKQVFYSALKCVLVYMIGIMLSGVVLVPVAFAYLNSGRTHEYQMPYEFLFNGVINKPSTIWTYLVYLFTPNGKWGRASMAAITLLTTGGLFFLGKKYFTLKIAVGMILVGYTFPLIGVIFNGFSYYSDRWVFVVPFVIAYIFVLVLPELLKDIEQLKKRGLLITGIYVCILVIASMFFKIELNIYTLFTIIAILSSILIFSFSYSVKVKSRIIEGVVVTCVLCNIIFFLSPKYGNYVGTLFGERGEIFDLIENVPLNVANHIDDDEFYRVDGGMETPVNAPMFLRIPSVSQYYSVINPSTSLAQLELENGPGARHLYSINGFDQRASLSSLASVKYMIFEKDGQAPFGFNLENQVMLNGKEYSIFKNVYSLPLGYTYENYLLAEDYDQLSALEKQEVLLQSVVLEEKSPLEYGKVSSSNTNEQSYDIEYDIEYDGVVWENGFLNISKKNAKIIVTFDAVKNAEQYIRFDGLDLNASEVPFMNLTINTDRVSKRISCFRETESMFCDRYNYMVNLGYYDMDGVVECEIIFPNIGIVKLNDIQVLSQSMQMYPQMIEELRQDVLQEVKIDSNRITGSIDLDREKVLCLSIPYSTGWKGYIGNQEVDILKANKSYIAITVPPGHHKIKFEYVTPGLWEGTILSLFGGIFLLGYKVINKKRK